MDRAAAIFTQILMALILGLSPLQAQTTGQIELKGTIKLPAITRVDSVKEFQIQINVKGKLVRGAFYVDQQPQNDKRQPSTKNGDDLDHAPSNPEKEPPDASKPEPPAKTHIPIWIWIILAVLLLGMIGVGGSLYYHRYVKPNREIEPYWRALRAIRDRQYKNALPMLTNIESILPPELRKDARFFIALCYYHLEEYEEAEHLASALYREQPDDENVAYLLAHICVERNLYAEAEPVLEKLQTQNRLDLRETRKLLSIVKFRLGMQALRNGDIEAAAEYFTYVETLGNFSQYIPADLRNRHISLGTKALFGRDCAAARQHFEALRKSAVDLEEEKAGPLLTKAAVGLVLADWLEEGSKKKNLEKSLLEACKRLHPEGPEELPWPEPVPGSTKGDPDALKRALEAADKNFDLPPEQKTTRGCLRDLHFLRAIEAIRQWTEMDGTEANKVVEKQLKIILSRLACSRALDERFPDVFLVAGLLMFYLHKPGPERTQGMDLLEEARKLGVRDPYALEIVNNRERIEMENADALDRYQQVVDRYLRDETVRKEMRQDLYKRLMTLQRLKSRYKPPDLAQAHTVPPTVDEMQKRSEALRQHILELKALSQNAVLKARSDELREQGAKLEEQARALEKTETELLALTGEELFKDI